MSATSIGRLQEQRAAEAAARRTPGASPRPASASALEAALFARHLDQSRRAGGPAHWRGLTAGDEAPVADDGPSDAAWTPAAPPCRVPPGAGRSEAQSGVADASQRPTAAKNPSSPEELAHMLAPHLKGSNADARFRVQLPDGTSMRLAIQHGPQGMAVQLGLAATAPVQSLKASAHRLEQRLSARCGRPVLLSVACVDDLDRDD